ncbi:MAG: endonuclease/exonuclease/phosphatase family protein [Candidatus Limnocylindrales bacterium]
MTFRIVTYNIRFGGRRRAPLIADVLGNLRPDVVIFQEATDPATVALVGSALEMPVVFAQRGLSVAALSRRPEVEAEWYGLSWGRSTLELRLRDLEVRIFGVHLSPGLSQRGESRRAAEVASLLRRVANTGGPTRTLIVGDFNAIAPGDAPVLRRLPLWIRVLLRFDGGIRTSVMESIAAAGFSDIFRTLHPLEPGATMPAFDPTVRLDFVMAGEDIARRAVRSALGPAGGQGASASDHIALLAEFDLARAPGDA